MQNTSKIWLKSALMFSLFLSIPTTLHAQGGGEERIRFQRGHSSAHMTGTIRCDQTETYLAGAKAGQKMSVHLSGPGAAYRLSTPSGNTLQGGKAVNQSTDELNETGDYKIVVECWKHETSTYHLEVVIQ